MSIKLYISTLLVIASTINFSSCEEDDVGNGTSRIVGGQITEIESVPYLVSFQYKGEHNCGGSIISKDWILSAAHCLNDWNWEDYKIRVGSSRTTRGGTLIDVDYMVPHPSYDQDTNDFDFLLIKLKKAITFSDRQQAIKLPVAGKATGEATSVLVSGWGETNKDLEETEFLRAVIVKVSNFATCNTAYKNTLTANMMCAGTAAGGQDSCQVFLILNQNFQIYLISLKKYIILG